MSFQQACLTCENIYDKARIEKVIANTEAIKISQNALITSILVRDPVSAASNMRSHRALVTNIIQ